MSKKFNKAVASTSVACLVVTSVAAVPAFAAPSKSLAGSTRIETAIQIAQESWNGAWKGSTEAVLASGNDANLVDALAVAPLAFQQKAPILLTDNGDKVDANVLSELKARGVKKIYLAAGTGVLTTAMENELKSNGMEVVRLGGLNRYETAKNIAAKLTNVKKVAVVNGEVGIADALSVASMAAKDGMAIAMTVGKDAQPTTVDLAGKEVYAIGGDGVLSDSLVNAIGAKRFGGQTRYETNAAVIDGLKAEVKFDTVYAANGATLVDALTGSVLAAQTSSPIVLADDTLDAKQEAVLKAGVNKDSKVVTLGGSVSSAAVSAIEGIITPAKPVVTDLKVEAVTADNLKEISIKFNTAVEAVTAENKDNYSLDSEKKIKSAELSEDKTTVILTLDEKLTNQEKEKITIKNIKADGKTYTSFVNDFTPLDNVLPKVASVTALGNKAIKVMFSEPIQNPGSGCFRLDGKVFYGYPATTKREVILKPNDSSALSVGEHTLTVAGVKDFADLKSLSEDIKFDVVEDKVAPTMTSVEATLETATITFSEDVDPDTVKVDNVYWKSGDTKNKADKVEKISGNKYKFTFTGSRTLPSYETTLYVEGVKDYSSNEMTEKEIKVRAVVDETRPEVLAVIAVEGRKDQFDVKFSKAIHEDSRDAKYFTVKNKKDEVRTVKSVDYKQAENGVDNTTLRVTMYDDLQSGSNTIKIDGIKDNTKLMNTMQPFETKFDVADKAAPKIEAITVSQEKRLIIVTYNKQMDSSSIGSHSNYLIVFDGRTIGLPTSAEINVVENSKAVMITLPEKIEGKKVVLGNRAEKGENLSGLEVTMVKDTKGNCLDQYYLAKVQPIDAMDTLVPQPVKYYENYKAAVTENNTIEVKFNKAISRVTSRDAFKVEGYIVDSIVCDNSTTVKIKIKDDSKELINSGVKLPKITMDPSMIMTAADSVCKMDNAVIEGKEIIDQVAPELAAKTDYLDTVGNTIIVPFNEELNEEVATLCAQDLVVVRKSDNNTLTPVNEFTTTVEGKNIKIELKDAADRKKDSYYTVAVRKDAKYIMDKSAAQNTAEEISARRTKTEVLKYTKPAVATLESIVAVPTKTVLNVGEDLVVTTTATYSDKSTKVVTGVVTGYDKTKAGKQTVTVTFEGKTATFEVEVKAAPVDEVVTLGDIVAVDLGLSVLYEINYGTVADKVASVKFFVADKEIAATPIDLKAGKFQTEDKATNVEIYDAAGKKIAVANVK